MYPFLKNASLETRMNMWLLMCRPLLEQIIAFHLAEPSNSNKEAIHRLTRQTFRKMTLLSKQVSVDTIQVFLGYDFDNVARKAWDEAAKRHEDRIRGKPMPLKIRYRPVKKPEEKNLMPKELVTYTNLLTALCPLCNKQHIRANLSPSHLINQHGIDTPEPIELFHRLKKIISLNKKGKFSRWRTLKRRAEIVDLYIDSINELINFY